ncbi:MAG: hypothetical protein IKD47_06505 [Clostridia bacterium]|nr:hypothetical protein [Clostridia bacterium]
MKYYVGVDGGGTKTELVVTDETGVVIARKLYGSSNPNDIGRKKMIVDMVGAFLENVPIDADMVCASLGLSGIGFSGCADELKTALTAIDKIAKVDICSDVQIALDAAYDEDGCIVIIGTGSVGYLRKNGEHFLVGGGGYMLDSSLSGYDLGREAIDAVLSQSDGRGEPTLLTEKIVQATGFSVKELVRDVYVKGKAFVASFAPFVLSAYEQGDAVAKTIVQRRVSELEKLLFGVQKIYGKTPCEITLFGGLSKRWDIFFAHLSERAKREFAFKFPENPVIYGALKRALGKTDNDFLKTFLNSYFS